MKRIVYVAQRFPVLTETFTTAEVVGLIDRGFELEVRSLRAQYREPDDPLPRDVPVPAWLTGLPGALRPSRHPKRRALASLRGAGLARGVDAARDHIHAQFPLEAASVAMYAARRSGASFSFAGHTYHDLDQMTEKLALARFVVVGSEFERGLIAGRYGADHIEKVHVRRLGVPIRPQRRGFTPGAVVSVGTLSGKKGHDVLIRAVGALREGGVDATLELVGDGPDRPGLQGIVAALRLDDRVTFAGALPHEQALARIAEAEVFALCCRTASNGDHDCLPVALMDAMSLGVPCVSSAAFGIPELIEDGVSGLLAPPAEPEAVADRLARALGDQSAQEIGSAGRAAVQEGYDRDRNLDALASLFRERVE
jgi:colanic acid/amylovoran biosynthesis glycosyltransferase